MFYLTYESGLLENRQSSISVSGDVGGYTGSLRTKVKFARQVFV